MHYLECYSAYLGTPRDYNTGKRYGSVRGTPKSILKSKYSLSGILFVVGGSASSLSSMPPPLSPSFFSFQPAVLETPPSDAGTGIRVQ